MERRKKPLSEKYGNHVNDMFIHSKCSSTSQAIDVIAIPSEKYIQQHQQQHQQKVLFSFLTFA